MAALQERIYLLERLAEMEAEMAALQEKMNALDAKKKSEGSNDTSVHTK